MLLQFKPDGPNSRIIFKKLHPLTHQYNLITREINLLADSTEVSLKSLNITALVKASDFIVFPILLSTALLPRANSCERVGL